MRDYAEFARLLNQHFVPVDRPATWLARRVGVSAGAVSRWLSGESRPKSPELILRIVDALRISPPAHQALLVAAGYGVPGQGIVPEQGGPSGPSGSLESEDQADSESHLLIQNIQQGVTRPPTYRGSAPPVPSLIIGREAAMHDLKTRIQAIPTEQVDTPLPRFTAIRGWPGVGKSTIAAALAHDPDVATAFSDGILWTALGPTPNLLSNLAAWGRDLGADEIYQAKSLEEATTQLNALLRDKRMLLIVDDVWEPHHAIPFRIGGPLCTMLITTRATGVAQTLAPTPQDIYVLPVLTDEAAIELLEKLAPTAVAQYPNPSRELIHELEGLPLAIQVAGHLLNVEISYGFSVMDLLFELREGVKILDAMAPADRTDLANETIPSVAVLLQRSTDRLDEFSRECFAYLGVFAPKPATFDLTAMKSAWQVDDPKPVARTLVDRGLLEPIPTEGRFQMHALLVMHAKSMLTDD